MNIFEFLFGRKPAKDKLKEKHGGNLHDCDFGIERFNKNKRSRQFVEELDRARGKKPKPGGGGTSGGGGSTGGGTNLPGVLFLNFNGGVVSGTVWNISGDLNIAYSGLTQDEIDAIVNVVKADYAGFNVVVTTDQAVYDAAARRQQVYITESYEWYGQAGGVSLRNTFGSLSPTPAFVFSSLLGYNGRYIQAAISHELGHTFGLYHQSSYNSSCTKTAEYNPGDGVNSPIMGYPYYLPDKWWIGPNAVSCTSIQDDAALITSKTL